MFSLSLLNTAPLVFCKERNFTKDQSKERERLLVAHRWAKRLSETLCPWGFHSVPICRASRVIQKEFVWISYCVALPLPVLSKGLAFFNRPICSISFHLWGFF